MVCIGVVVKGGRGGKGWRYEQEGDIPKTPNAFTVTFTLTDPISRDSNTGVPTTAAAPVILPTSPSTAMSVRSPEEGRL